MNVPERLLPIEIKSDRRIQTKHLKGLRSFLTREKEQIGLRITFIMSFIVCHL